MNNGYLVRNEFKFSGFTVKVYFLVITLNAFSSHTKKNLNNTIKIVENSVIYLFFKPSATHARSNRSAWGTSSTRRWLNIALSRFPRSYK